jgi:hypothetical protein
MKGIISKKARLKLIMSKKNSHPFFKKQRFISFKLLSCFQQGAEPGAGRPYDYRKLEEYKSFLKDFSDKN